MKNKEKKHRLLYAVPFSWICSQITLIASIADRLFLTFPNDYLLFFCYHHCQSSSSAIADEKSYKYTSKTENNVALSLQFFCNQDKWLMWISKKELTSQSCHQNGEGFAISTKKNIISFGYKLQSGGIAFLTLSWCE